MFTDEIDCSFDFFSITGSPSATPAFPSSAGASSSPMSSIKISSGITGDSTDTQEVPFPPLTDRGAFLLREHNLPVSDPSREDRTQAQQRRLPDEEARALLSDSVRPKLEFKVLDFMDDEFAFLKTALLAPRGFDYFPPAA